MILCGEREVKAPQAPRKPELASVFREYRNQLGPLTIDQERAIQAIIDCRTAALGGHVSACDTCGHQDIAYNSCRNRHCPKCGALAQARWIERQEKAVLPVEYHHVVFTVPDILNPLFRADPAMAYRLLFAAASETLIEVAANPRHLGAQIGSRPYYTPGRRPCSSIRTCTASFREAVSPRPAGGAAAPRASSCQSPSSPRSIEESSCVSWS